MERRLTQEQLREQARTDGIVQERRDQTDPTDAKADEQAATLPEAIEGWWFSLEKHDSGMVLEANQDCDVCAWIEDGALVVKDDREYYPSGYHKVPFAVVDKLRELYKPGPVKP